MRHVSLMDDDKIVRVSEWLTPELAAKLEQLRGEKDPARRVVIMEQISIMRQNIAASKSTLS